MLSIIKNVAIPKTNRSSATSRTRKYPFAEMEVGDMFFVPNKTKNTLTTLTSTAGRKLGKKFVTRLTHMIEQDDGTWEPVTPGAPLDTTAVLGIGVWCSESGLTPSAPVEPVEVQEDDEDAPDIGDAPVAKKSKKKAA